MIIRKTTRNLLVCLVVKPNGVARYAQDPVPRDETGPAVLETHGGPGKPKTY
jgi:hypothetical protein